MTLGATDYVAGLAMNLAGTADRPLPIILMSTDLSISTVAVAVVVGRYEYKQMSPKCCDGCDSGR